MHENVAEKVQRSRLQDESYTHCEIPGNGRLDVHADINFDAIFNTPQDTVVDHDLFLGTIHANHDDALFDERNKVAVER